MRITHRSVIVIIPPRYVVPFPVIFTGGIYPLFWEPVVSIGAFNLPSYGIDLALLLGLLLDDKIHSIGIQIADVISFWLVDVNLHLRFDKSNVERGREREREYNGESERVQEDDDGLGF
ncbi:putative peptide-N(4)-(N-acetyl-beta-glucosaminyl)asparagine amidase [Helianthus debilis subsp. tardiflorus]